jgi:transcriptional regulator GlxA family with amidase domain
MPSHEKPGDSYGVMLSRSAGVGSLTCLSWSAAVPGDPVDGENRGHHDAEVARTVSRYLVTYLQRPGNQAQMSVFTASPPPEHDLVRRVTAYVTAHLDGDLSTAALAAHVGIGARHLARLFVDQIGYPPGRYVRKARVEAAANLLITTSLPMTGIARRCGFGSAETLRLAFLQQYGTSPSRFRATHVRRAG